MLKLAQKISVCGFAWNPPAVVVAATLLLGSALTAQESGQALSRDDDHSQTAEQQNLAEPIERQIEGWTVKVDPELLEEGEEVGEQALLALANHLQRIRWILPEERVEELQELPIWIELENPRLENMQYHPSRGWLLANGHDLRLAKHVHIPRAAALLDRSTWAKHPYVVLHELAHAYHDQVLGFGHAEIKRAFEAARQEGTYEDVLDHRGQRVRHYGLNNEKEFFAEATEAYLGVNDFYPFVRAELQQHDPRTYKLLRKIWGPVR